MNIYFSNYPDRFLMPEPMTDPPWIRAPIAWRGPPIGAGPPVTANFRNYFLATGSNFLVALLKGESK